MFFRKILQRFFQRQHRFTLYTNGCSFKQCKCFESTTTSLIRPTNEISVTLVLRVFALLFSARCFSNRVESCAPGTLLSPQLDAIELYCQGTRLRLCGLRKCESPKYRTQLGDLVQGKRVHSAHWN